MDFTVITNPEVLVETLRKYRILLELIIDELSEESRLKVIEKAKKEGVELKWNYY